MRQGRLIAVCLDVLLFLNFVIMNLGGGAQPLEVGTVLVLLQLSARAGRLPGARAKHGHVVLEAASLVFFPSVVGASLGERGIVGSRPTVCVSDRCVEACNACEKLMRRRGNCMRAGSFRGGLGNAGASHARVCHLLL